MPHKRAKRSVREKKKSQQGVDFAPEKQPLASEAIPKSVARVLDAAKIRADFKKKRKLEEESESRPGKRSKTDDKILGIQPGESLQHFNKRVENDMRPLVRAATKNSLAVARNAQKKPKNAVEERSSSPPPPKRPDPPKEFETLNSTAPRRLNDIAQAPPELKKPPVRAGKVAAQSGKKEGVVSMAQKLRMEEEREKAIQRYRQMKAKRLES